MENASKALLMAGGVLISLLIIGAFILLFNNLSTYQDSKTQNIKESQIVKFNNQFETYNRNEVRGNDLVSLANRVIDYNARNEQDGYEKMKINIKISNNKDVIREKFCYDNDKTKYPKLLLTSYNQDNIQNNLTDIVKKLEEKYNVGTINYINNLSSNISKILDSEKETEKLLPKSLNNYGGYDQIKEDTETYYEYTQLKRAYFDCKDIKYSKETGRIVSMEFEFNQSRIFE